MCVAVARRGDAQTVSLSFGPVVADSVSAAPPISISAIGVRTNQRLVDARDGLQMFETLSIGYENRLG